MQFIDLKAQYTALKTKIDEKIEEVMNHGQYIMGREVGELEEALADYVGTKHVITCANGTDALQMLFMAYGIKKGDAVFCPDVTFIASIEPACVLGATPVFCDITTDTYNLSPESLERQILSVKREGKYNPKAVVAVDFLGNPADYVQIEMICRHYNLILIEDAAQGFGAECNGIKCGAFGNAATTSFFPAKPLGCYGDGGAVFTSDDEVADVCKSIRVHGKGTSKYDNRRIGMNSRLDTLQAAILLVKFEALIQYEIEERQKVAQYYNKALQGKFITPFVKDEYTSVYAQYALLAESKSQRDGVIEKLNSAGIPNMIYYPTPMHRLPVFAQMENYGEAYVNAEQYCSRTVSLPMHPYLSKQEQDYIIEIVL